MPKERRRKTNTHDQSVRLDKRQFALDGGLEHIDVGEQADLPVSTLKMTVSIIALTHQTGHPEVLSGISSAPEKPNIKKKKEKQQLKHDAFLQRLESGNTPYSKSHGRRLKRKAKEEIANGLQDIALALPSVEDELEEMPNETPNPGAMDTDTPKDKPKAKQKRKAGQIGEGKGVPLSKNQRKQVLKTEKLRQALLLATPEFAGNPFKAIRTHAQNTLVKHQQSR
ncbi:ribosome biogenesis protein SLX9-domain-containing protein [Phellopilus nigrolimitatus]|nr:ribosome biogenesis protein SLX9-domain-containing protein [Phellopilus nigrolimitatus]